MDTIRNIRKQRGLCCSFVSCKRTSYVVLEVVNPFNEVVASYPECRKCFTETVDMRGWSDVAKTQFKELTHA